MSLKSEQEGALGHLTEFSFDLGTYPVMVLKICVRIIYHSTSSRNSDFMRMVKGEGGIAELCPLPLSHCLIC